MMVILRCLMINDSSRNEMTCLTPSICITALQKLFTLACCLAKEPWAPFLLLLKMACISVFDTTRKLPANCFCFCGEAAFGLDCGRKDMG